MISLGRTFLRICRLCIFSLKVNRASPESGLYPRLGHEGILEMIKLGWKIVDAYILREERNNLEVSSSAHNVKIKKIRASFPKAFKGRVVLTNSF